MSQFVRTMAGVFAATGSNQQGPSIAERMSAAVVAKIAGEPERILRPAWWAESVSMIPEQSPANTSSAKSSIYEKTAPHGFADLCISPAFRATSTADLTAGIERLLAKLPTLQSLNCLSIAFSKRGDLQISLAIISSDQTSASQISAGTRALSVDLTESLVNYSNRDVAQHIDQIFGSFAALGDTSYYVCVRPNDPENT